ncbi:hypothetical protein ACQPXS_01060 [Streptomyces sp. CA-142005]|uniref:hypothetical protein n=1 Tax=Streptomyces sp. CA-142005 TaxID=3240052 RepID=UPI003D92A788
MDVWDSERVLFIDYDAPIPHTLMAHIGDLLDDLPYRVHSNLGRSRGTGCGAGPSC